MFKVLNAYAGWSNVNYVLNDVKNPIRTLKIAGPLGLGICAVLYLLANVAYFAYVVVFCFVLPLRWYPIHHLPCRAATPQEIQNSGVTVAALFFKNVFGVKAQRALSVIVALRWIFSKFEPSHDGFWYRLYLSALGNVITVVSTLSLLMNEETIPSLYFPPRLTRHLESTKVWIYVINALLLIVYLFHP